MNDQSQIQESKTQMEKSMDEPTRYKRGGMIFSLVWAILMLSGGYFTTLRTLSPSGTWQEGALAGIYLLGAVVAVLGFVLYRADRMKAARNWLLGSAYFTFFVSTLLRGGETAIFMLVVMVIGSTVGLTLLTMPFKEARRFLFISIAYSAGLTLLSLVPIPFRAGASESVDLNAGPQIAAVFGILVVILIVARARPSFEWFMNQPVRTKMIALIAGLSLLTVGVLFAVNISNTQEVLTTNAVDALSSLTNQRAHDFGEKLAGRVNTMGAFALGVEESPILAAQNESYSGTPSSIEAQIQQTNFQWISASDYDALIRRVLVNDLANEARHFKEIYSDLFVEVFITDRYGANVAAADRTSDYYQADEGWWQAAYNDGQGAVYIGDAEYDESAGVWGFNIAVPIYSHETGEVLGIMRTTAIFDQFLHELGEALSETAASNIVFSSGLAVDEGGNLHILAEQELGATLVEGGMYLEMPDMNTQLNENDLQILANYVVDPAGTPVGAALYEQYCESCHFEVIPTSANYNQAYQVLTSGGPHATTLPTEGNTYVVTSALSSDQFPFVDETGWRVMIYEPEASILAPVRQQTLVSVLTALGVAVVVAGVAAFLAQRIADPIVRLTNLAREFAAGKYDVRAEVTTADEVGQLSDAFNTMAGEVGRRTVELEERSRELEASQRVTFAASERTTPGDFLNLLVNLIADQFDVYHCQVYVVDQDRKNAVLEQSTGYAGRQLLQRGHFIPLDQEALVTRCINTGEPVLVADVSADPSWLPNPLLPYTQSELVVPLVVEGNVFGALDIQDRVAERFTEQTVAVFTTMTEHVASLFQTTELLEEIETRTGQIEQTAQQLRMAAEIAEQLGVITDLEDLLEEAVNQLQASFGFYHAHIYLLDENGEDLVVQAGSGHVGLALKREKHTIPLSREASLVARAGRSKQPVIVPDVREEEGFMANPLLPDTRSEVSIPLVSGERLLGVLDLQDEQVARFSQADVDTLTTLAGQMASSIESAELFGRVEHERAQTEALYEISRDLNAVTNEDEMFEVLSRRAVEEGASNGSLIYLELDQSGEPDWAEITAIWGRDDLIASTPVGTRFYLPELPFSKLWLSSPDAPLYISDVSKSDAVDEATRQLMGNISSGMVYIPLIQAGRWLGLIIFSWAEPHEFSTRERDIYNGMVGMATQAVTTQKARVAQEEARTQAETLYEISNKLNIARTKEEILEVLSEYALGAGAVSGTLISLTTDDEGNAEWAEIEATYRIDGIDAPVVPGMDVGSRFYMPDMPFAKVWMADRLSARLIPDVKTDENIDDVTREAMLQGDALSLVIIPLSQADTWLGFITFNWSEPHHFSSADTQIYNSLIGLSSQAVAGQRFREAQVESEARFRMLVDNAPDGIFLIDPETASFTSANTVAQELIGYTMQELEEMNVGDLFGKVDQPDEKMTLDYFRQTYLPRVMDGEKVTFDWHFMTKSGVIFVGETQLVRLMIGDKPAVRASIQDVTERKAAEETIIQGDQLKSEFLANMSHELRTPLNSIVGYTDVLLLGMDGDLPKEIIKDIEAIQENSHTLLGLIDDILDLAKIEAGRMTLEVSEVAIPDLFNEVVRESAGLIVKKQKPIEIKVDAPANLTPITADAIRVKQMINNLLSNAIKFTDEGTITLRAFEENHEWLVFQVEDTGIGMSEEDLNIIFEKFRQADGSYARIAEGTGLGLNITQQLVQLHGGKIDVKSERGVGSTFSVWLPIIPNFSPLVSVKKLNKQKVK